MIQQSNAPLQSELRWLVRQRWSVAIAILLAVPLIAIETAWTKTHTMILAVGMGILLYNLLFWLLISKPTHWLDQSRAQRMVAWTQIIADLISLTLLVVLTNGLSSPLLPFFVLHMIFASLLLQTPRHMPYIAWISAMILLASGLWLSGKWPQSSPEILLAAGWAATLLLTVYITMHITNTMQINNTRTNAVLEAAPDGILIVDEHGRIDMLNPEAQRMFGYASTQIIGESIEKIITHTNLSWIPTRKQAPNPTGSKAQRDQDNPENFAIRRDGSRFPIEVSFSSMKLAGKDAFSMVIHDITERKQTESTLRKLNDELTRNQEQLIIHEKMATVGRMASGIAHEIANPLANMDGMIQLIERNPDRLSAETPAQLREQIARINEIVRQLKDFAHPHEDAPASQSISDLIRSSIQMIRFDRRSDHVIFEEPQSDQCCRVHAHAQSIQQVLVNLLINALDATADVDSPRVHVTTKCLDHNMCCISIQDNGMGISPQDQQHIFEPFYTTKPPGKGTGLGLSISYNLVQRDGGFIEIESQPAKGTTAKVYLPKEQPNTPSNIPPISDSTDHEHT